MQSRYYKIILNGVLSFILFFSVLPTIETVQADPSCFDPPDSACPTGETRVIVGGEERCCNDWLSPQEYNSDGLGNLCYRTSYSLGDLQSGAYVIFSQLEFATLDVTSTEGQDSGMCWYSSSVAIPVRLRIAPLMDVTYGYYRCSSNILSAPINFDEKITISFESYSRAVSKTTASGCPEDTCTALDSAGDIGKCCQEGASHPYTSSGVCSEFSWTGDCVAMYPIVCTDNGGNLEWESTVPDPENGGHVEARDESCEVICELEDPHCLTCCNGGNFWTELGCITPTQKGIVAAILRIFIGVITAIVIIRLIQAGMLFNTDDPDKINEAKSIATSAIISLIFGAMIPIILNFIGVDILGLGQILGIG